MERYRCIFFPPNNSPDLRSNVFASLDNCRQQIWQGDVVVCGEVLSQPHKRSQQEELDKEHGGGGKSG